jgi:uncharacterized membrane protein YozB (DUF420 family)
MPAWKVFIVGMLAAACLGLAFATLIVPITIVTGNDRWLWLVVLLVATALAGSLFVLFLRRASTLMARPYRRP